MTRPWFPPRITMRLIESGERRAVLYGGELLVRDVEDLQRDVVSACKVRGIEGLVTVLDQAGKRRASFSVRC